MSDLSNLTTIRSNIIATLATESEAPKPSYNVDGEQMDWNGFRKSLMEQLRDINLQIQDTQPYEIHSRGAS